MKGGLQLYFNSTSTWQSHHCSSIIFWLETYQNWNRFSVKWHMYFFRICVICSYITGRVNDPRLINVQPSVHSAVLCSREMSRAPSIWWLLVCCCLCTAVIFFIVTLREWNWCWSWVRGWTVSVQQYEMYSHHMEMRWWRWLFWQQRRGELL